MNSDKVKNFISNYRVLLVLLAVVYAYGVYTTVALPKLGPMFLSGLSKTFWLFGLASTSVILLSITGLYLLYKHRQHNIKWALSWGLAFLFYAATFLGIALAAFGLVNRSNPVMFFIYRTGMIIWAAGIFYGLSRMVTDNKMITKGLSLAILILGFGWFTNGLLIRGNIEYTMYGFLSFIFVPVSSALGYLFWRYDDMVNGSGMMWLSSGMFLMSLSYMAWAPWHHNFVYVLWFFVFNISLSLILTGLVNIPYEEMSKVKRPLSSSI